MPSVAMIPLFEELSLAHTDAVFLSVDVDDVKVRLIDSVFQSLCFRISRVDWVDKNQFYICVASN
ncbi:hypothetical protein LINPERPRIM_LOCUS31093 [Linum perenne]